METQHNDTLVFAADFGSCKVVSLVSVSIQRQLNGSISRSYQSQTNLAFQEYWVNIASNRNDTFI